MRLIEQNNLAKTGKELVLRLAVIPSWPGSICAEVSSDSKSNPNPNPSYSAPYYEKDLGPDDIIQIFNDACVFRADKKKVPLWSLFIEALVKGIFHESANSLILTVNTIASDNNEGNSSSSSLDLALTLYNTINKTKIKVTLDKIQTDLVEWLLAISANSIITHPLPGLTHPPTSPTKSSNPNPNPYPNPSPNPKLEAKLGSEITQSINSSTSYPTTDPNPKPKKKMRRGNKFM
jgi:hypothetical protein